MGQPVAVLSCRDDDFELPACIEDGLGEELVCPIGEDAHANKVTSCVGCELLADRCVNEPLGGGGEPPVASDRDAHQVARVA